MEAVNPLNVWQSKPVGRWVVLFGYLASYLLCRVTWFLQNLADSRRAFNFLRAALYRYCEGKHHLIYLTMRVTEDCFPGPETRP